MHDDWEKESPVYDMRNGCNIFVEHTLASTPFNVVMTIYK